MTKVTLNDLTNLNNQQSSINTINGNNTTIETAFDNTLSRDGTTPNQMEATLDMNSNHVINLPEPAHGHEPLRLQDITNFIDQFALVQTPGPGDAGKIIRVRADEIAYDISSIQINAGDNAIHPVTNDSSTLGQLGKAFSDLFLASGAVINFNSGDVTLTHSADKLEFQGGTYGFDNKIYPITNDGSALGDTTHNFSDLFLASGAVINFNNSDVTITHSSNVLAFAGASTNYTFDANVNPATNDGAALGTTSLKWADLFLASGAVINFNSSDVTITHSSDQLTIGGLGAYTVGSTGGLQVNNDIVSTGGAIYALGGAIPVSTSVPGVYFGKESANNNRAIQIVSPAAGSAYIDFAPISVDFDGRILVDTSAHTMAFSVNGAEEVKISSTATYPSVSDGNALGTTSNMWSDLFLASGGVINFNNGNVTITHSNNSLAFAGASSGYSFDGRISRDSQFFLDIASVPYINWDSNDYISYDRASNKYNFVIGSTLEVVVDSNAVYPGVNDGSALGSTTLNWSDLFLADGAVINFNNSNYTITHSSGLLNFSGAGQYGNTLFVSGGYAGAYSGGASALKLGGGGSSPDGAAIGWGDGSGWNLNLGYNNASTFTPRYTFKDNGQFYPSTNDGAVLGTSSSGWSDLFLASGGYIDFGNNNVRITHAANRLTFTGGSNGYYFSTTIAPTANDGGALGSASVSWSDLFLATGGVIGFGNGDYSLTHSSGVLTADKDLRVTTAGTNAASVATLQGTQTLTNKTINLTSNTLSGTTAQFNTALSDDDFATLTNSVTLTNKTLTSPSITNPSISGTLTNTQATVFSGVITPSLSADVNDWAPSGFSTATTILLTGTGGWQITGLAGGSNGRLILVFNADAANTFIIKNNSSSSAAANRIQCNTDLSLLPGTGCLLYYETTNNFWRLVGGGGAGGGIANAYSSITDGTTTANAAGTDTIKFRVGSTGGITAAVGSNDPTHGDNLLISLNINGLTADTSPDRQADKVVTYDASASVHKSVLLKDIVYPQCTVQVFTSSGTWNRPTGCRRIKATITGGGGAGGSASNVTGAVGSGGASGATAITYLDVSSISSLSVTVGAAAGTSQLGASGANGNATGGSNGSSVTSVITTAGGTAGTASNGTININGADGPIGLGSATNGNSYTAASSFWGPGGAGVEANKNGNNGAAYGSGGSGAVRTTTNRTGGAGAPGIILIEEFY